MSIETDDLAFALVRNDVRHIPAEVADGTCNGASERFVKGYQPVVNNDEQIFVSIDSPGFARNATLRLRIVFEWRYGNR